MFHRLLVPLDGSNRALQALSFAARLARASQGTVVLLRVVSPQLVQTLSSPLPSASMQTMLEVERAEAMRYLTTLASNQDMSQVRSELVVQVGPVASTILTCAAEQRCDLLVLSRRGQTDSPQWNLGSVTEKVLHNVALPVWLVQDEQPDQGVQALIALDGSANSELALPLAAQLVEGLSSGNQDSLTLLHVLPSLPEQTGDLHMHEYLLRDAQRYLSQATERLREQRLNTRKFNTSWSLLPGEDVAKVLLDTLERSIVSEELPGGYNLLIMTTRGRGNAAHTMLGSITERILRSSRCSLFIVEPQWQQLELRAREASFSRDLSRPWSAEA